jgi:proline dehydrogenase
MLPPIANNFVAGKDAEAALSHVETIGQRDVGGILNLLGEHYDTRVRADEDTGAYIALVDAICRSSLDCCISVKPSQIGLDVAEDAFQENLSRIVSRADEAGVFVWIDMEDHTMSDTTLEAYEHHVRERGGGVGVCVQANLKRTPDDLERLAALPGRVRLVKGAYAPPPDLAYLEKARVDDAYRDCLEFMFQKFDDGIAVGSHDPAMVDHARALHDEYGIDFEIQMLMGVREDVQFELAREDDVYQYIPYGNKWLSYFYRRIRERKENALFALRAVLH